MATTGLPRKLLTGKGEQVGALQAQFSQWHVDPYCYRLWLANRMRRRRDTFIGLMDTMTWTLYIAPCFGVTPDECQAKLGASADKLNAVLGNLRVRLTKFENVPDNLQLVSGSTSIESDAARTLTWGEIKPIYGPGACLVPWSRDKKGFDGHSHATMLAWIKHNPNINPKPGEGWAAKALGFAIQRDAEGYYVRFSSGFNQAPQSNIADATKNVVFAERSSRGKLLQLDKSHELRDLPKEWAMKMVEILARDLHMGYHRPTLADYTDPFFERMVSRGEHQTSKFKRLT